MKDKVFSRYISKMYPELLNGNLYFDNGGIIVGLYSMSYNNCYIGTLIINGSGYVSSMNIVDRYHSLKYVFGDEYKELLLKWFNKEHEVMLYSLLGNDCGVVFIND
jgi:hypothetical protein